MKTIRFCFGLALLVAASIAGAQESPSGDAAFAELLKKIDTQAMPDSYVGKNHQKWVDTRMAKLTKAQRDLHGRLWEAKRRMNPNQNVGQSFVKILHYISRGEKLGRILTGDGYGQPQYSRPFVQLQGIKPGSKTRIHGRVTNAKGDPIEGVMVTAYDEELEVSASVFTGVDGKFELNKLRKTIHQMRIR